jgi:hypothetical protein
MNDNKVAGWDVSVAGKQKVQVYFSQDGYAAIVLADGIVAAKITGGEFGLDVATYVPNAEIGIRPSSKQIHIKFG